MTVAQIARAQERARKRYPRSTAFQGAYVKGARAKIAGLTRDDCPYESDPKKTWRKSFRAAWLRGHESV